ncbi:Uncharacterized protein TCM_035503 [Theobroma cacao]|uniref:Uncharacterized protein n=1 Tax=Theobroma cacao TaxID=3641 RepID=A0A061FJ63_THECC|nr:Uncharacterized protein TCM_035503 [Theobroma cacao]
MVSVHTHHQNIPREIHPLVIWFHLATTFSSVDCPHPPQRHQISPFLAPHPQTLPNENNPPTLLPAVKFQLHLFHSLFATERNSLRASTSFGRPDSQITKTPPRRGSLVPSMSSLCSKFRPKVKNVTRTSSPVEGLVLHITSKSFPIIHSFQ